MNGFTIAKIRGIAIRANVSVLIIGALIAWSLSEQVLPEYAEGYSTTEYWLAGGFATIAFFAGLIAHELGHSFVALQHDVRVKSITLWLFGGVAELEREADDPTAAMQIAAAGPIVSLILAFAAALAAPMFQGLTRETITWFAAINGFLALFNLLPAFPMDGGRLYQAWRWRQTGDRVEATDRAAGLGLVLSGVLIGLGVLQTLFSSVVGGVWLVLIGLFLREAARAEVRHVHLNEPLEGMTVSQVMTSDPITVAAGTTLSGFVAGLLFGGRHAAYPVVDADGSAAGLITLNAIRGTTQDDWVGLTVLDLTTPLDDVVVLRSDATVPEALSAMGRQQQQRALVIDDGKLVGIVAPSDVARLVTVVELVSLPPHIDDLGAGKATPTAPAP